MLILIAVLDAGALTGRGGILPSIHNHIRLIIIISIIFILLTIAIISIAVPAAVALTVRGEAARTSPPTQDPPAGGGDHHRGDCDHRGGADDDVEDVDNEDYLSTTIANDRR